MIIRIMFTIAYIFVIATICYIAPDLSYYQLHRVAYWIVQGVYLLLILHILFIWWHPVMGRLGLLQPRPGLSR